MTYSRCHLNSADYTDVNAASYASHPSALQKHSRFIFKFLSTSTPGLFLQSYFLAIQTPAILLLTAIPSKMWDFTLACIELHEVPLSSFLDPVELPLKSSLATLNTNHFPQFGLTHKHAKRTFYSIMQDIEKDF